MFINWFIQERSQSDCPWNALPETVTGSWPTGYRHRAPGPKPLHMFRRINAKLPQLWCITSTKRGKATTKRGKTTTKRGKNYHKARQNNHKERQNYHKRDVQQLQKDAKQPQREAKQPQRDTKWPQRNAYLGVLFLCRRGSGYVTFIYWYSLILE